MTAVLSSKGSALRNIGAWQPASVVTL